MGDNKDWSDIILQFQEDLFKELAKNFEKKEAFSAKYMELYSRGVEITERAAKLEKIAHDSNYIPFKLKAELDGIPAKEFNPTVIYIGYVDSEHFQARRLFGAYCDVSLCEDSSKQIEKIISSMENEGLITKESAVLRFEGMKKLHDLFKQKGFNCEYSHFKEREEFEKNAESMEGELRKKVYEKKIRGIDYEVGIQRILSNQYNKPVFNALRGTLAPNIKKYALEGKHVIQVLPLQDVFEADMILRYNRQTEDNIQWMSLIPFKLKPSTVK